MHAPRAARSGRVEGMELAALLEARLALIARVRAVEVRLAQQEHARAAAALVRGRTHELGNQVQVLKLASMELERRLNGEQAELLGDLRQAAEAANAALTSLLAAARPDDRSGFHGEPVVPVVRAAIDQVRRAIPLAIDMRVDASEDVRTRATGEELEASVLAAVLDATWGPAAASRLALWVRQRQIEKRPWVELILIADRAGFEPALGVVRAAAQAAGGEASICDGREGVELVIELPIAT